MRTPFQSGCEELSFVVVMARTDEALSDTNEAASYLPAACQTVDTIDESLGLQQQLQSDSVIGQHFGTISWCEVLVSRTVCGLVVL